MGRARVVGACCSVVAASVMIAACGSSGSSSSTGTGSGSEGTTKVGVALFGPKNDNSFNQAAFAGVTQAAKQDPNLKVTGVLENKSTNQQASDAIQTLGPANKVVVGVSQTFGPVFDLLAPKYPNTYFLDIAGYTTKLHKNVTGFANDWGAPSYVGGVIAANMTKSNVVGYVGGAEIPPTTQAAAGFAAGAKSVKPNIKVLSNIVGDFNDVAKAKAATTAMLTDGADVVFPFLDAGIAGAYAAGKASGKNPAMFKLIVPDCQAYSNMVGTEYVNNTLATATMLAQHAKGTLKPGAIMVAMQNPEIQTLKLCPKYQADAKIAKLTKDTIDGINSGAIKLPAAATNPRPSYPYQDGFNGKTVNPGSGG